MANNIQDRLKIAVKAINFKNLRDVSSQSGIPYRSLQDYLSGKRIPGSESLIKLARIGINPNYILLGEGSPSLKNFHPRKNQASDRNSSSSSLQVIAKNPYSQRLRRVCKELGLNAHELAKILGVPKSTVERWIYGTTKPKIGGLSTLLCKFHPSLSSKRIAT